MPDAAPLTSEQALAVLFQRVQIPVFFNKLAEAGIHVRDDAEAQQYLDIAVKLRQLEHREWAKTASVQTSQLSKLSQRLDGLLAERGVQGLPAMSSEVKLAAEQGSADPELAHAVLSLLQAETPAA